MDDQFFCLFEDDFLNFHVPYICFWKEENFENSLDSVQSINSFLYIPVLEKYFFLRMGSDRVDHEFVPYQEKL
jgi:hypothetical protein